MSSDGVVDDAIVELLGAIARRFRGELRQASAGGDSLKVAPFQQEILAYIGRHAGISVMALANLAGRDKAQVTRIIAELETLGLISRLRSTTDRRSTQLSLTESGETLFRRVLVKRGDLASAMLNALDPEERNALHAMLVKMRSGLADAEH
jgi:DNA-binding MarR family transcriptional regulator